MIVSIFHIITKAEDGIEVLNEKIVYVVNFRATQFDLIGAVNVGIRNAYVEMLQVKKVFNETANKRSNTLEGKAFFHYVFSPDSEDCCSLDTLVIIANVLAEFFASYRGAFQVVYAVHVTNVETEKILDLPHVHFIVNNISFADGTRFNLSKKVLYEMKQCIDKVILGYGISEIKKKEV